MYKAIITHPAKGLGDGHLDETIAVGLLLSYSQKDDFYSKIPVYRKEPTREELDDPLIAVIDIGMEYNPEKSNFDHHQDNTLPSSYVLVARHLGIEDKCRLYFPWWDTMSMLDARGPFETAKWLEISNTSLSCLTDPLGEFVVDLLTSPNEAVTDDTQTIWKAVGDYLFRVIEHFDIDLYILKTRANLVELKGFKILTLDQIVTSEAFGIYRKTHPIDISISIHSRNNSFCIYRYEHVKDYVRFENAANHPLVTFVHKNGFLLVTSQEAILDEVLEILESCLIER